MINSDSQTVDQQMHNHNKSQPQIVTLQYLVNENKMKQIALNKATHLIDLLKIQLQVQKNSQQQSLEAIQKDLQLKYQAIIEELSNKVDDLEFEVDKLNLQLIEKEKQQNKLKRNSQFPTQRNSVYSTNAKNTRAISRPNSRKEFNTATNTKRNSMNNTININNIGSSRNGACSRYSQKKLVSTVNEKAKSINNFFEANSKQQNGLYRVQKSFLMSFLMAKQQSDTKIFKPFDQQIIEASQQYNQCKQNYKISTKAFQQFIKNQFKQQKQHRTIIKKYSDTIKIQQLVIQQLNRQIYQYQDLLSMANISINKLSSVQEMNGQFLNLNGNKPIFQQNNFVLNLHSEVRQYQQKIGIGLNKYRNNLKVKISNMENQNKQLKRILDEMIRLIKTNKKMGASLMGNSQFFDSSK